MLINANKEDIALHQGWLKGGYSKNPPLELKILENPPPLEKFWNTPPPSKIRREAPAPNWI